MSRRETLIFNEIFLKKSFIYSTVYSHLFHRQRRGELHCYAKGSINYILRPISLWLAHTWVLSRYWILDLYSLYLISSSSKELNKGLEWSCLCWVDPLLTTARLLSSNWWTPSVTIGRYCFRCTPKRRISTLEPIEVVKEFAHCLKSRGESFSIDSESKDSQKLLKLLFEISNSNFSKKWEKDWIR